MYILARASSSYSSNTTPARSSAIRRPRRQDDYPLPRSSYTEGPAPPPAPKKPTFSNTETARIIHDLFQPHLPISQPLPEEVAARMVTHASWNRGMDGHNGRFTFLGRRVLHAYLMMYLSSRPDGNSPKSQVNQNTVEKSRYFPEPEFNLKAVTERLLDTYILGEYVGGPWDLHKIMRWTPALPMSAAPTDSTPATSRKALLSSGLYKVRGACVEATIGGIYHQYVCLALWRLPPIVSLMHFFYREVLLRIECFIRMFCRTSPGPVSECPST